VPEYARQYLENLNRPYEEKDLLEIAKGQLKLEDDMSRNCAPLIVCDTNLYVIKVWSEYKYGRLDQWIQQQIQTRKYEHYLLTQVDFPWIPDPLREHPKKRAYFFKVYEELLMTDRIPFNVVSGSPKQRVTESVRVLKDLGIIP
jgi:nicotinamide riboside kinase